MQIRHKIAGGDFTRAGNVASAVKKILQQLNIDHKQSKRIVIALYEGEVNVVAHAYSGVVDVDIDSEKVRITISDKGPGIKDIEQAMEEGFSTATPQVREMGFGAGMGLSNMKRNSDFMEIRSVPGEGTLVELINYIRPDAS
ncbi:MAG TPA: anti-sigma regulatory factor [Bacteroidales bacterium]|nr:anti-sigma regulatory factor [Bacteroidales bacterium]